MAEKLSSFPLNSRNFLAIGYILRIIPILNIVGSALIPIGWFKIYMWGKSKGYLLALIGSALFFVMLVYSSFASFTTTQSITPPVTAPGTEDLESLKNVMTSAIDITIKSFSNQLIHLSYVLEGIGLILESMGILYLSNDTNGYFPKYLVALFLILGILMIVNVPAMIISIRGLEELKTEIQNAKSPDEIFKLMTTNYMSAMAPVMAVAFSSFMVGLITYVIAGYKFWKIRDEIYKLKIVETTQSEISAETLI